MLGGIDKPMPIPHDSFEPFLKRPLFYLDEGIQMGYNVDYVDPIRGDKLFDPDEKIDNLMLYLSDLNLSENSTTVSIDTLRNELINDKGMQEKLDAQAKDSPDKDSPEADTDAGMGEGLVPF